VTDERSTSVTEDDHGDSARRIVVMDDPPHLIGCAPNQAAEFMERLVLFRNPLVIILSEDSAREDMHSSLQSCLSSHLLQRVNLESIYCPPVTTLKVKKILEQIADAEKLRKSKALSSAIEAISSGCMGDLRHAILRFQFFTRHPSSSVNSARSPHKIDERRDDNFYRDTTFSALHSVSKLLSARLDNSGKVNINVDDVADGSDYDGDVLYSFLQGNSVASVLRSARLVCSIQNFVIPHEEGNSYSTSGPGKVAEDVTLYQCAEIFSRFSDLDVLWYRQFDSSKPIDHADAVFPVEYCQFIAARASAVAKGVGETERQQVVKEKGLKSAINPVYRPKALDCRKNIRVMQSKLMSLRNVLAFHRFSHATIAGFNNDFTTNFESLSELAISSVPFLRILNQFQGFSAFLNIRLASLSIPSMDYAHSKEQYRVADIEQASHLEVEVLAEDDIAEFDDS